MTLVGFARKHDLAVYSHPGRVTTTAGQESTPTGRRAH
jgi:FdhD protein